MGFIDLIKNLYNKHSKDHPPLGAIAPKTPLAEEDFLYIGGNETPESKKEIPNKLNYNTHLSSFAEEETPISSNIDEILKTHGITETFFKTSLEESTLGIYTSYRLGNPSHVGEDTSFKPIKVKAKTSKHILTQAFIVFNEEFKAKQKDHFTINENNELETKGELKEKGYSFVDFTLTLEELLNRIDNNNITVKMENNILTVTELDEGGIEKISYQVTFKDYSLETNLSSKQEIKELLTAMNLPLEKQLILEHTDGTPVKILAHTASGHVLRITGDMDIENFGIAVVATTEQQNNSPTINAIDFYKEFDTTGNKLELISKASEYFNYLMHLPDSSLEKFQLIQDVIQYRTEKLQELQQKIKEEPYDEARQYIIQQQINILKAVLDVSPPKKVTLDELLNYALIKLQQTDLHQLFLKEIIQDSGIITSINLVYNIINNITCILANPKDANTVPSIIAQFRVQHGPNEYNPGQTEPGDTNMVQLHFLNGKWYYTRNDEERLDLFMSSEFDNVIISFHPKDTARFAKVIAKQINFLSSIELTSDNYKCILNEHVERYIAYLKDITNEIPRMQPSEVKDFMQKNNYLFQNDYFKIPEINSCIQNLITVLNSTTNSTYHTQRYPSHHNKSRGNRP